MEERNGDALRGDERRGQDSVSPGFPVSVHPRWPLIRPLICDAYHPVRLASTSPAVGQLITRSIGRADFCASPPSCAPLFLTRQVDVLVPAPVCLSHALGPQPMRAVRDVARTPHRSALHLVTAHRPPSSLASTPPHHDPLRLHLRRVHASEACLPVIRSLGRPDHDVKGLIGVG